jgi:serine/threonine-protein kinase
MVADPETPDEQIKVMDFGLAKILGGIALMKKVTDADMEFAVGTPSYISPEQVRGDQIDHRCDLYSVGVIAYELLSGQLPFDRESNMDLILAHATEIPPTFTELGLRSWVPRRVESLVMDCLSKDPGQRPQSARELADRFESALERSVEISERPLSHHPIGDAPAPIDPNALVFQIDAWMPQRIAMVKIRGFVHDAGGQVTESESGVIRVRLGGPDAKQPSRNFSALSDRGRRAPREEFELELRLKQIDPDQDNRLQVTIVFHPPDSRTLENSGWRRRCEKLFCEVRAYLMG